MHFSNPHVAAALEVLRATKHDVGSTHVKDGEMRITIDGVPRTFEEIFQMVESYASERLANRKSAS